MGYHSSAKRSRFLEDQKRLSAAYREAGMSEETIQAMHEFDLQTFRSERTYRRHTQNVPCQKLVTDPYRETHSRFSWIGEIENPHLLDALEHLSEAELKLLTLYIYEGYTELELSKVFGVSQPAIHKRIDKILLFLKNF